MPALNIRKSPHKIPLSRKRLRRLFLKAFALKGRSKPNSITVCFLKDKAMRCLNKKFLNIDGTTDVLTFGIPDSRGLLHADIAVCIDEAQRNARAYATSLKYELELYALHGLLHILGYKDKTLKQRKTMQSKAEKILTLK